MDGSRQGQHGWARTGTAWMGQDRDSIDESGQGQHGWVRTWTEWMGQDRGNMMGHGRDSMDGSGHKNSMDGSG